MALQTTPDPLDAPSLDGIAASVEGAGAPTPTPESATQAEASPEPSGVDEAPASSTEAGTAQGEKEPEKVEGVEEEPDGFDWGVWDGAIDNAPEDVRPALTAYDKHMQKKHAEFLKEQQEALQERDDIIQRYQEFLENNSGEDPRTLAATEKAQKLEEEYAKAQGKIAELEGNFAETRMGLEAKYEAAQAEIDRLQEETTASFLKANPILHNTPTHKEITLELLADEEYTWSMYDLPQLVTLPKAQRDQVRELAKRGTPVDIAIEHVTLKTSKKKADRPEPEMVGSSRRKATAAAPERRRSVYTSEGKRAIGEAVFKKFYKG